MKSIPLKYYISKNSILSKSKRNKLPTQISYVYNTQITSLQSPLIPLMAFGVSMPEDIVISLKDDSDWGMIEICKMSLPNNKDVWFSLDSKLDGKQYIGLPKDFEKDHSDLKLIFPAHMYDAELVVNEYTRENKIYYKIQYTRFDKEEIHFEIPKAQATLRPLFQNGNTMNHSQDDALVSIYLERMKFYGSKLNWISNSREIQKLFIVNFNLLLKQTVCGFLDCSFSQTENNLTIKDKGQFDLSFEKNNNETVVIINSFPRIEYKFNINQNQYYELATITVKDHKEDLSKITFYPALPDFRFKLEKDFFDSTFIIDIQDKKSYMSGSISKKSNQEMIKLRGEKPFWSKERPINIVLNEHKDTLSIDCKRV